ncbi:protein NPGR2-like isoform X2 [Silene latifolia]
MRVNEMLQLPESPGEEHSEHEILNIQEAELSLSESGGLNSEEARALLGRYEYQKGNIEAALQVFEGINIGIVTSNIKITLATIQGYPRRRSKRVHKPQKSIRGVSLLFEALFLKAKSFQALGRFKEAAQSCKDFVDLVESLFPDGMPENFGADSKLQMTIISAVELLPELWKLAGCPHDVILSYRQALLHGWNLDAGTASRLQKDFAVYLLYSGVEASPPNLGSQINKSFVPQSNLEEAILLLTLLLRKFTCRVIEWDPSVMDHLSFALNVSNQPQALTWVIEDLPAGSIERKEVYHTLALCYHAHGDNFAALNLLRKLLHHSEEPNHIPGLLLAAKICSENPSLAEEGITYARRALAIKDDACHNIVPRIHFFLGILLSNYANLAISEPERIERQLEAVQALECAVELTNRRETTFIYHLSLEYAIQRELDLALYYAKLLLKLPSGNDTKGLLLLARILSGQKRYGDGERIIDAALDQTEQGEQGELLRTKAKLQIAQGCLKKASETYSQLLAILKVKSKSFGSGKGLEDQDQQLQLHTWVDLACFYIKLSRWSDAESCLSKVKAISPNCASRWHTLGLFYEAKGLFKEALDAFQMALNIDPCHVPSLIGSAINLRQLNSKSNSVAKSFLMNALKFDRMNHVAWFNLGLLCQSDQDSSISEAVECFQTATILEETAPIEPFR